jgi:cell division protein FtsL
MRRAGRPAAHGAARVARVALVAAALASLGVFHVWSRTRVVSAGYALGKLQNDHVKLESDHDRLRIEVETLRSPATLERFARTKLGMAPPEPGAVSAAGPLLAEAGAGGAGKGGVVHLTGPAEPSLHTLAPSPPARAGGEGRGEGATSRGERATTLGEDDARFPGTGRAAAAWPAADSGGPLAFRGPLPAGRAAPLAR